MPDELLRSANAGDEELLFRWANDGAVRANAFSQEPIAWDNHRRWFDAKISDDRCRIFIIEHPQGTPIGQIRFDIADDEAVVDVSVVAGARGGGFGTALIREGASKLFSETHVRRIVARVKETNVASRHAFLKAGFSLAEQTTCSGEAVVRMVLQRG